MLWFDNLSSFLQGQRQRLIEEFNHNRQEDIPIEPPTVSVGPTMSRRRGRNHCPANDDDDDDASTFEEEEEEESDNTENSDSSSNCSRSPSMATGAKSTGNIFETQLGPPLSMPTPEPLFPEDTSQAAVVGPAVNQHGDNVLHAKVSGCPPVEAVKALLEACGDDCVEPNHLAQQYNVDGLLPIHVACSNRASSQVIQLLCDIHPESAGAVTQNASRSLPLHLLCDYGCSINSIRVLLQTQAGAASVHQMDRMYCRSPLYILNARKSLSESQRCLDTMRKARRIIRDIRTEQQQRQGGQHKNLKLQQDVGEAIRYHRATIASCRGNQIWQKAALLAVVEYEKRPLLPLPAAVADGDKYDNNSEMAILDDARILHACIGNPNCPPFLQEYALLLLEDSLTVPDGQTGRLPLHLVVANHSNNHMLLLDVLSANPAAACVRDNEGCYPLTLALRSKASRNRRRSHGLGELIEANPLALQDLNLEDSLYPILWSRFVSVDSLFTAVRAHLSIFSR